jgi:hypothetical protein
MVHLCVTQRSTDMLYLKKQSRLHFLDAALVSTSIPLNGLNTFSRRDSALSFEETIPPQGRSSEP